MKKITTIILALIMVCAMSVSAFADGMTLEQAENTALKQAGLKASEVKRLEAERDNDNNSIEVEFVRRSNNAKYEYEISQSGKILEKSIEYPYKRVKSNKKISKTAAKKKAAKYSGVSYSIVKKGSVTYKKSKGIGKYKIRFRKGDYKYECELLARNGQVIEYEWEYVGK